MSENIHPLPQRKDLPPEVAAIALPPDEDADADEDATVILNANEADLGATYREIRPGVLIPVLLAWMVERPTRWIRDHQAVAASIASSVSAAALATGLQMSLNGNDTPVALPPATVTVSAVPPPPATPTIISPTPSRPTRTKAPPSRTAPPVATYTPSSPREDVTRAPAPIRTSAPPTRRPTVKRSTPSNTASTPTREPSRPTEDAEGIDLAQPSTASETTPTQSADDSDRPIATQPPQELLPSVVGRGCAIRVDLDPLLDLCVLS